MTPTSADATVVTTGRAERLLVGAGLPLVGAAAGWLLLLVAEPARHAPVGIVRALARTLTDLSPGWALATALAAGAVVGAVLAVVAEHERVEVAVGRFEVAVRREGRAERIGRDRIAAAFVDGRDLVIADRASAELLRERTGLAPERLATAFVAAGYPWRPQGDPWAAEFRRWVAPTPDLPSGAGTLLAARAAAVRAGRRGDARTLRAELGRIGVVVRDADGGQEWRLVRAR